MLAHDLLRIRDACQVHHFIPLKKLLNVAHELLDVLVSEAKTYFTSRTDEEIA